MGRNLMRWTETSFLGGLPQYRLVKSVAEGLAQIENAEDLKPVLVQIEEGWQIGYLPAQTRFRSVHFANDFKHNRKSKRPVRVGPFSCCTMLRDVLLYFQSFPAAPGGSMQHGRDMNKNKVLGGYRVNNWLAIQRNRH
jgi:hypothetical protein